MQPPSRSFQTACVAVIEGKWRGSLDLDVWSAHCDGLVGSEPEGDAPAHAREQTPRKCPQDHAERAGPKPEVVDDGQRAQQRCPHNLQQVEEGVEPQQYLTTEPSCSGFQITGVTKKAICITLATIGRISRNRAQNVPNSKTTASASIAQSSGPGIANNANHVARP